MFFTEAETEVADVMSLQLSRERPAFSCILGPISHSWGEESFYINVFIFI